MWRDPEGGVVFQLEKHIRCKVYKFKRLLLVDVRTLVNDAPSKKGVSLAPELLLKVLAWPDWQLVVNKVKSA